MDSLEPTLRQLPNTFRLVIGALLLLSGFSKLLDTADFRRALSGFKVVPSRAVRPLALSLPVLELVVGGWLALGDRGTPAAAVVAGGLFIIFAAVITGTLLRGNSFECGCFGRILDDKRATWRTVGRNVILTIMASTVALRYDTASTHLVTGVPALLLIGAAVVGALLIVTTSRVFRTEPARRRAGSEPTNSDAGFRSPSSLTAKGAHEWMSPGSSPT